MYRSPAARRAIALAAVGLPLVFTPGAHAAWFASTDLAGPALAARAITGGTAGLVTVAGVTAAGGVSGATHTPGAAFGAVSPFAPGTASIGAGGAILASGASGLTIRRVHADGSESAAFALGGAQSAGTLGDAAIAPSGAALALVTDQFGNVQIWRQASETEAPVLLTNLEARATIADVAPSGNDGFVVALAGSNGDGGTRVLAMTVDGTTLSPRFNIDQQAGETTAIKAIGGAAPMVAYVVRNGQTATLKASPVASEPTPRTVDTAATISDLDALGSALAWTPDGGAKYGLIDATGAPVCAVAEPFTAIALGARGGTLLGGLTSTGRVGIVPVSAGCPAGTPQLSAAVPNAQDLSLATDADGTLIAAVGRGTDNAVRVVVDDITPPAVGQADVPATVAAGTPFTASVTAADPWGVADIAWSVDGAVVAHGASVTIPGQPSGAHTVTATASNAAGLTAASSAPLVVTAVNAAVPTPTPAATPVAAPAAKDATAPVISDVSVTNDIFRPSVATMAALPRGSAVHFRLSEAATVRATILRGEAKKGGRSRCEVRPHGVPVTPLKGHRVLLLRRALAGGINTLGLNGRRPAGERLPRGRYRVSLQATDAAGNRSDTVFIRFTVC